MKRTILPIALLALALNIEARSLVVTTTSGTKAYFPITDTERPVMQFINGNIWVSGKHYQFADIKNFRITDDEPTAIAAIPAYTQREGCIVVDSEVAVTIATLDGKVVNADVTRGDGTTAISVASLPPGIYVIKAGKASFKFVKR